MTITDLDFTKASQLVSITGIDSTGLETNPVNSTSNGDLQTSDTFLGGPLDFAISLGLSAVEVKSGVSPVAARKAVRIFNNGNSTIYWGGSGVTSSTGEPIFRNTSITITAGPNCHIYLIASSTGNDIRCKELP